MYTTNDCFRRQILQEFDTEETIKKEDEESVNGRRDEPETEDCTPCRSLLYRLCTCSVCCMLSPKAHAYYETVVLMRTSVAPPLLKSTLLHNSLVTSRPTHKGKGRLVNIERFLGRRPRAAALMGRLVTRLYPLSNYNTHVRETGCTWL